MPGAMEPPLVTEFVRGRCACGRRYRVKNAAAGVTVSCPNCNRAITIGEADVRAARIDERMIPLQQNRDYVLEAVPIYHGELALAPEGSRPGLTGEIGYDHDEALLVRAQRGVSIPFESEDRALGWTWGDISRVAPGRRPFLNDLLASFYFAGASSNALNILFITVGCWAPLLIAGPFLLLPGPLVLLLTLPLLVFIALYTFQFMWSTLRMTAEDVDVIPWVQSDWSLWDDAICPAFWMALLALFCSAPAFALSMWLPDGPARLAMLGVALAGGWFFWPAGIVSLALGNSIVFLRPDWLARIAVAIGPAYLMVWLSVLVALACWVGSYWLIYRYAQGVLLTPVLGLGLNFYFGYVVFRNFGLLFRHFRERFPWKF